MVVCVGVRDAGGERGGAGPDRVGAHAGVQRVGRGWQPVRGPDCWVRGDRCWALQPLPVRRRREADAHAHARDGGRLPRQGALLIGAIIEMFCSAVFLLVFCADMPSQSDVGAHRAGAGAGAGDPRGAEPGDLRFLRQRGGRGSHQDCHRGH
eukprot:714798-Pyramimonas_sp.AAC.3